MRRCSFLFSLVVVVVSAQTSIPNITLVGNIKKKELHCVIANDTSNSAITFVGDGIMNEDDIQYDLPANICMAHQDGDPFECVEDQPNIMKYTRENSIHGAAGQILDRRWEGFRTIRTPKGNYTFPEVVRIPDHDFKIAFSVRVKQDGHLLLCDGPKPQDSHCYWFILAGWEGKTTAMRRCEKEIPMVEGEYPKKCKQPVAEKNTTNLTSLSKWSHFRIEMTGNITSLYTFGDKDPILTYSDGQPIKLGYLTFRSPTQTGFWKLHQYNFMKVAGDVTITTTTLQYVPTSGRCVAIYLKLCPKCKADISLLDGRTRLAERNVGENKWMEIQLRIPHSSGNITAQITASLTKGAKWYIGEILECRPDGIRKITTEVKNSEEICCNIIKSGRTICKKDIDTKTFTPVTLEPDCPRNTIGSHCIPCTLFGSCDNYKYCQYAAEKTIQCYCPKGFSGNNCLNKCNDKKYGDQCTKTCNRCLTGCSHDDGRCEKSECKDKNLYGDYCQSFIKPVLKDNPQIEQIRYTNVTLNLTAKYDGKEPPTFFKIQLRNSTGVWSDVGREAFSHGSKLVTINNLLPDTNYSVRILLETENRDVYQVDEFIPTSNFRTTCKELSSDMIKVMVDGTSVRLQVTESPDTCNIEKYKKIYENYESPISNPIISLGPCSWYTIQIIKKESPTANKKPLFNVSFKTGNNTSEVIQCPEIFEVKDTSVILKWDYHGDKPIKYEISYRKYWNKHCKEAYPDLRSKRFTVENANVTILNLDPDTRYIVEVTPTGIDDKNLRTNIDFDTTPSDILKEDSLNITSTQSDGILEVTAQMSDCSKITGPIDLTLEVKCESSWCEAEDSKVHNQSNVTYNRFPFTVKGLTNYSVLTTIRRNNFEKKLETLHLTTSPSAPGPVIDPVIYSKTENSMFFRWRPPYPPMGNLANYRIKYTCTSYNCRNTDIEPKNCRPSECLLYPDQHCCSIDNLTHFKEYNIKICAMNEKINNCGPEEAMKGKTRQEKPNPPDFVELRWKTYSILTVTFKHPSITNGPLTNYSIYIYGTQHVNERIHQELSSYSHEVYNIEPAKIVSVRVMVSNKAGDSNHSIPIDTISPPPTLPEPTVLDVQATNLTIGIPTLKLPNEVTCSLLVFVIDKNSTGAASENQRGIFEDYNITQNGHKSWVAIDTTLHAIDDEQWKIMIGSTAESSHSAGISSDHPLNTDTEYDIIVVVITTFKNVPRSEKYTFTKITNFGDPSANNLYLLVLIIVPVICAICFVVLRRRGIKITMPTQFIFRNTENAANHSNMPLTAITPHPPQRPKVLKDQPAIYQNAIEAQEEDGQFSRMVKISELEQYVKNSLEKSEFERQHALFPRGQTKPWVYGMKPENKKKNRYINLAAYDHTRVKLKVINDDPNTDYINANYIDGYNHPKAFIATQGPKETTLNDFWRMIWQENVEQIVMIANLVEGGKKKVAKYWPDINETMTFGDISVKYISVDIFADYEERVFSATRNGQQSRRIKQLHFVSWPDHGVPLYPQSLAPFHKRMLAIAPSNKPVVVHCSAGVGRTGTFILCDTCLRMAALEGQVDILHHQFNLREQRPNMVDNVEQYKLVHMVLLQCLIAPNTSILCTEDMTQSVETLLASKEIQKQMKYLETSAWQDDAMKMGSTRQSAVIMPEKNRLRNVLPDECSKVILSPYPITDESTTYINAIRVAGFRDLSKYVVTQYPMKNTVGDFWRLIHQQEITLVVCLNTINKKDPNLPIFYPTEDCQEITPVPYLTVQLVSVDEGTQINTYTFDLVEVKQNTITTKVTLLQLNGWKYENITTDSAEGLLSLYEEANRLGKSSDEVLISCYDGVKASGLFTAMSFVIDKIKLEQVCDVCLAVRSVRHSRGEFVRDVNQFKYLYKCALEYVLKFELYSNFRS